MKAEFYKHIELDSDLEEIISLFKSNEIYYEVSSAGSIVDETIIGSRMFAKYTLKILPDDFKKANKLISESLESKELRIEDFKYLEDLDNNELLGIVENPGEWSIEAEIVARKILAKRGVQIDEQEIKNKREIKRLEFEKGKSVSTMIQLLYLVLIILGFYRSIILIIAGIGMGYYYSYGTRINEEGKKFYVYDEKARVNGKIILYIGVICFLVNLYFLFRIDVR